MPRTYMTTMEGLSGLPKVMIAPEAITIDLDCMIICPIQSTLTRVYPTYQVTGPGALNAKAKIAATPRKANATR
jgi:hypothetical protein